MFVCFTLRCVRTSHLGNCQACSTDVISWTRNEVPSKKLFCFCAVRNLFLVVLSSTQLGKNPSQLHLALRQLEENLLLSHTGKSLRPVTYSKRISYFFLSKKQMVMVILIWDYMLCIMLPKYFLFKVKKHDAVIWHRRL